MSHMLVGDPFQSQSALISQVVEFIEKNRLDLVKKYVPSLVQPNARSINRGILLKDIALYMKRNEIYDYLQAVEKSLAQKRVDKFEICFANIDKMYIALQNDDLDFVIDALRAPENVFCNDNPAANRALLDDFINKAHGECKKYITGMSSTFIRRGGKLFN